MFDGLSPEVEALLNAAKSDLPVAEAAPALLEQMVVAMSVDTSAPLSHPRRRSMLGKALTAKAAAIAGVLVLTGGVASAATGSLPGPVQDSASHAAEHVGIHIPNSDDQATDDANDNGDGGTSTTVTHPDNHGNDVSTVAHDDSTAGADHGSAVCTVASDGKCQPNAGADHSGQGKSGDHRQNGDHATNGSDDNETTSTTVEVNDDNGGADTSTQSGSDSGSSNSGHGSDSGGHHGSDN